MKNGLLRDDVKVVFVRMTQDERDAIAREATRRGTTIQQWAANVLNRAAKRAERIHATP